MSPLSKNLFKFCTSKESNTLFLNRIISLLKIKKSPINEEIKETEVQLISP